MRKAALLAVSPTPISPMTAATASLAVLVADPMKTARSEAVSCIEDSGSGCVLVVGRIGRTNTVEAKITMPARTMLKTKGQSREAASSYESVPIAPRRLQIVNAAVNHTNGMAQDNQPKRPFHT